MTPLKQLKKSDFLATVTAEPMTRGQIVEALEDYDFIDSWLTFLIDHFKSQGKLDINEAGMIFRTSKAGASSGPRMAYRVIEPAEGEYELVERRLEAGEALNKEEGWAITINRAVKNATSDIYQTYMSQVRAIKALLPVVEDEAEDEAKAAA